MSHHAPDTHPPSPESSADTLPISALQETRIRRVILDLGIATDDAVADFERSRPGGSPYLLAAVEAGLLSQDDLNRVLDRMLRESTAGLETVPTAGSGTVGRRVGNYEILDRIAHGGVGVVYKARQQGLDRVVALKVLLAGGHASAEEVQRFRNEARNAARLKHPYIVPIHDTGEEGGLHFFTMDLIEGRTLARIIDEERITPERACRLVRKVAEALHYAHGLGIIHRDIKPANIIVDARDAPHVTDFGLAKAIGGDARLTRTGTAMGTPAYMPPEQAEGDLEAIGPRSDVYALGATLYEMLTLSPPFEGATAAHILKQVMLDEPLPPRRLQPRLSRDLEVVILKAMAKEPDHRYATAADFEEDVRRFLDGEPIRARRRPLLSRVLRRVLRNRPLAWSLTASVLVLGAVGTYAARSVLQERERAAAIEAGEARRAEARRHYDRVQDLGAKGLNPETVRAAVDAYTRTLETDPTFADACYYRGRARLRLGEHRAALEDFERAVALDPTRADSPFYAGLTRLRLHGASTDDLPAVDRATRWAILEVQAMNDFGTTARLAPGSPYAAVGEAYLRLLHREDPKGLLETCRAALELDPLFLEAYFLRAAIRGMASLNALGWGRTKGVSDARDEAFRLAREDLFDPAGALSDVEQFRAIDRISVDGRFLEASVCEAQRDFDRAIAALDDLLAFAPDHVEGLVLRSELLSGKGEYEAALRNTARLLRLDPADPRHLSYHAWCLIRLQHYEEAEDLLDRHIAAALERRGVERPGGLDRVYLPRSICRAVRGDIEGFTEDFVRAHGADTGLREWAQAPGQILGSGLRQMGSVALLGMRDLGRVYTVPPERKATVRFIEGIRETLRPEAREAIERVISRGDVGVQARTFLHIAETHERMARAIEAIGSSPAWRTAIGSDVSVADLTVFLTYLVALDEEYLLSRRPVLHTAEDYVRRAAMHYRKGALEAAKEDLKRAYRLAPDDRAARYGLATVLARMVPGKPPGEQPRYRRLALRFLRDAVVLGWDRLDETARDPDFAEVTDTAAFQRLVELARAVGTSGD